MIRRPPRSTLFPYTRSSDLVAIDEVQLAGDLERGHVFTDRLLNLRGSQETLLLGADRKSTRLNSSHANISYAVFCLKKKKAKTYSSPPSPQIRRASALISQ